MNSTWVPDNPSKTATTSFPHLQIRSINCIQFLNSFSNVTECVVYCLLLYLASWNSLLESQANKSCLYRPVPNVMPLTLLFIFKEYVDIGGGTIISLNGVNSTLAGNIHNIHHQKYLFSNIKSIPKERYEDNETIYQICSESPISWHWRNFSARKGIFKRCMFKVCSKGMFKICSKLTIKILERRQLCRSNIFIVDFQQIIKIIKIVIPTKVFFCGL